MSKPLLVGELNPYGADSFFALYPEPPQASGGRLARILGLTDTEYLARFDRANLCAGKWSDPAARDEARRLTEENPNRVFVLLGAKVARAFRRVYEPYRVERSDPQASIIAPAVTVVLPHPSGLNRAWHDHLAPYLCRMALREAGVDVPDVFCPHPFEPGDQFNASHCAYCRQPPSASEHSPAPEGGERGE